MRVAHPGMRIQNVWGIYTLEDFHSSAGLFAWHAAVLGAVSGAIDIQASFFNVTFPTTPGSLLPNAMPHFSDMPGLMFSWPLQRQCFLMHCYTQVRPLFLLDGDTNGNLQHSLLPSIQLPHFSENVLLCLCSRQV